MKIKLTKNEYIEFLIISAILTFLVLLPFLAPGIYNGHDLQFHMSRFDGVVQALQDHQFPIALYPLKNYGYGYASPLFYSDIFLIIPSVAAYFLNISPVTLYKIIAFLFTFIFIYTTLLFTYDISDNKYGSIIAATIASFSNYYLTDHFVRFALGEIMAFSFLPLLFWNIYRFIERDDNNFIGLGVSFSLVLYCHNITFFLSVIVFAILIVLNYKKIINKHSIVCLLKASLLGILLSMGFLFPMIEQLLSQDFVLNHIHPDMMKDFALSLGQLLNDFYSQFEMTIGNTDGLLKVDADKSIGLLVLLIPLLYIFQKKKDKQILNYMFIAYLFIVLSTDLIPVYKIKMLSFLQFPSRFYIVCIPLLSFVISSIVFPKKRFMLFFILSLTMFNSLFLYSTITNKDIVSFIPENVTNYELFTLKKYAKPGSLGSKEHREEVENGEYLPYKYEMNYLTEGNCIDFISKEHAICEYERNGSKFDFYTNFENDEYILLPITYYKGYAAYEIGEDGSKTKQIDLISDEYTGRVRMVAQKGQHHYFVYYKGTNLQKSSTIISIICSIYILYYFIKANKKTNT